MSDIAWARGTVSVTQTKPPRIRYDDGRPTPVNSGRDFGGSGIQSEGSLPGGNVGEIRAPQMPYSTIYNTMLPDVHK